MWRVGVVGAGYWSSRHLSAWKRIPGVTLEALCDTDPRRLAEQALAYDIPAHKLYDTMEKMLKSVDLDTIDIITGPDSHLDLIRQAAAAGKHIMCQKPFARNLQEAEQMVAIAGEAGVRLMVTENWRWLEPFQCIKQVLESGVLGKLTTARYIHTDYYTPRMAPDIELPQPVFRQMPQLLFYEMGAHWFDLWRFLFGMPVRVYAELSRISAHIAGEDNGVVTLGHDGFFGYMDMSWATRQQLDRPLGQKVEPVYLERLTIDGTEGTLKLYTDGRVTVVSKDGGEERAIKEQTKLDHEESHVRLQKHFIDCLDSGEDFQTSGADNLITLRLLFGVYESAQNHAVVHLS